MKFDRGLQIFLGIIILIFGVTIFLGTKMNHPAAESGHKDIYYCPMHPSYTSDRPGNCPICGMTLVKREKVSAVPATQEMNTDVPGYASVPLTPGKQQLIGIKTTLTQRKNAIKTIQAFGRVTTNHDLYILQDEYIKAYTEFVTVFRDYRRYEHLRRNWETRRDLQIKLHEAQDKLLRLGLGAEQIEQLKKVDWAKLWDQPEVLFLNDNFAYWVTAQISEADLGYVEVGEEVDIDIPAYREKSKGIIRSIGGTINDENHAAYALIELKGYRGELKANMFINTSIRVPMMQALIVPRDAVMDTGTRKIVFVEMKEGVFEPRVIQTDWETDEGFEVKSGLKEGERIVANGNFLLDSESRIQAGLQEMPTMAEVSNHGQ